MRTTTRRRRPLALLLLAGALALQTGCNRQDTEALARIGRKVVDHAQTNVESLRERVDVNLKAPLRPSGLKERVELRLQWDALLADSKIDVSVNENEVELAGTLKSEELRRRAVDLTESTLGVQSINIKLEVPAEIP